MIVLMKGKRSGELVWSIVEGIGFSGQVVGLHDETISKSHLFQVWKIVPLKGNP